MTCHDTVNTRAALECVFNGDAGTDLRAWRSHDLFGQFRLVNALLSADGRYPVQIVGEPERRSVEHATAALDLLCMV